MYMYEWDWALNNLQGLIYSKTQSTNYGNTFFFCFDFKNEHNLNLCLQLWPRIIFTFTLFYF